MLAPYIYHTLIRAKVGRNVVALMGNYKGFKAGGTGFQITAPSGKHYVMTNRHICELADGEDNLVVTSERSNDESKLHVLFKSEISDLCLLSEAFSWGGLSFASGVSIGDSIHLLGHPKLQPLTLSSGELIGYRTIRTAERVDKPEDCKDHLDSILNFFTGEQIYICSKDSFAAQMFVYSRGGSSGSPVVNIFGNVVGILFAGNPEDAFESYAVPLSQIKAFLKDK